jgi:hypothetical protein
MNSMEEEGKKIIEGNPAGYPSTSPSEQDSKNIFQGLINTKYIRGELRVMDKYPNSDGILDITDEEGHPLGKIDFQLKTLQPRNYSKPAYQCERRFFVYCQNSTLPVILAVVNQQEKKAYWRHIDHNTLLEVSQRMTGESYSLSIPLENCIDGVQEEYISDWTKMVIEYRDKVWNYDSLKEQKKAVEQQLKELDSKMQNPTNLPLPVLKDVHEFLDRYNYILDREFSVVKQVLYPDYWKIGIGITKYEYNHIQFLLYPVEFKKAQILVKEIKPHDYVDIDKEMMEGNILLLANLNSENKIKESPSQYAYDLLEDSILRIAGKYNFPISDEGLAHEYLISFIDRYHIYLDMEKNSDSYSLKDLKYKLYSVLPMLVGSGHGFANWVVEYNHNIDSYNKFNPSQSHKRSIQESIKKINEGFMPKVKVTITSELYNIDLISYYINFLEQKGIRYTERKYQIEQYDSKIIGVEFWKTWNKEPLWTNVKLFYKTFYGLYEGYIKKHFPYIQDFLKIVRNDETTVIHIFRFDETHQSRPYMEVYHLRPTRYQKKGEVLCFLEEDPNNPIDRKKYFIDRKFDCTINDKEYEIMSMHVQLLDFMFDISPTYSLINKNLNEKLRQFFVDRKRNS